MRIIAGKYRRRKLLANPGHVTRPITDRVKETLFERLGPLTPPPSPSGRGDGDEGPSGSGNGDEGVCVLDAFAGTGTLGLEALSRGARSGVFIENDPRAFQLLKRNVSALDVEETTFCWRTDALRCSFRPKGLLHLYPYHLVFFDPPYRMISNLKPGSPIYRALDRLARNEITTADALLILRTPQHAEFHLPPVWTPEQTIEISSMELHMSRKQTSAVR